jgi:hypothetical protein
MTTLGRDAKNSFSVARGRSGPRPVYGGATGIVPSSLAMAEFRP